MTAGCSTYRAPVKGGGGLLPGVRGERVQRTLRGRVAPWSKLRGAAVPRLKASEDICTRSVLHRRFAGSDGVIEREQNARNMLAATMHSSLRLMPRIRSIVIDVYCGGAAITPSNRSHFTGNTSPA